jgi:hypothetical protein
MNCLSAITSALTLCAFNVAGMSLRVVDETNVERFFTRDALEVHATLSPFAAVCISSTAVLCGFSNCTHMTTAAKTNP